MTIVIYNIDFCKLNGCKYLYVGICMTQQYVLRKDWPTVPLFLDFWRRISSVQKTKNSVDTEESIEEKTKDRRLYINKGTPNQESGNETTRR